MKIAVACGGTGGHIFPGLAVANVLLQRDHTVTLWLAGRDIEDVSLSEWSGETVFVRAAGFQSHFSLAYFLGAARLLLCIFDSVRKMRRNRPDVLLAMGSYASVGPVVAARLLNVPVALHEANAAPGRAISFLSPCADAIALAFESAGRHLKHRRIVYTGFPLRSDLGGSFANTELMDGFTTVLVAGGSQGARFLDDIVSRAIKEVHLNGDRIQVIHLARPENRDDVERMYRDADVPCLVFGFLKEIGKAYNSADLAITRAGAATCAELHACQLPALLVPLPAARRNHQMLNALAMKDLGGIDVVAQDKLDTKWMVDYLHGVCANPGELEIRRDAMRSAPSHNATDLLADLVENISPQRNQHADL
ncbi:MAG: UDP-N-acetylglucosamine--N-acetylmuramyl-(pentapeptide) pyrophosphoryl-undecaprenol N-acetylglucosamine transferase [Kiritimatiellae bacterium]|nr:UDP-N-acetylglucosamine--N-acetylmuramyl-(pentapeptide) pyrophosphoryl-undecaprenol N-acetylglucosamine transferase [Kiritimatiellia bacterium]